MWNILCKGFQSARLMLRFVLRKLEYDFYSPSLLSDFNKRKVK